MKKSYIIIIAIIAVIILLVLMFSPKAKLEGNKETKKTIPQATAPAPLTDDQLAQIKLGETDHKPATLTFDVVGGNFYFTPNIIKVKKGDTVKINFKNNDGFHDFKIDEFNVAIPRINSGEEANVTFIADKTGTFEYYCSVGTHRLMGMKGDLVVE